MRSGDGGNGEIRDFGDTKIDIAIGNVGSWRRDKTTDAIDSHKTRPESERIEQFDLKAKCRVMKKVRHAVNSGTCEDLSYNSVVVVFILLS